MKKLTIFLFFFMIIAGAFSQPAATDTITLGKKQEFSGICSMKGKGLVTIVLDSKNDEFQIRFYDLGFQKKWEVKFPFKDLDFNPGSATPCVYFADNYIYMVNCYTPMAFMLNRYRSSRIDKSFTPYVVQISYDGKVRKSKLSEDLSGSIISLSVSKDDLNICMATGRWEDKKIVYDFFFTTVDAATLKEEEITKIHLPKDMMGWKMADFKDSISYLASVDMKGYDGWNKLPLSTVDGKLFGITPDGKIKKELVFKHTSQKFNPCPDFHFDEKRSMNGGVELVIVESPLTNLKIDTRENCFYNYGLLTDDTKNYYHKEGFYIDKYKLNGKKFYSREYSFIDYENECKEVKGELCSHGITNRSHMGYLFPDEEETIYLVTKIDDDPFFSILIGNDGLIKKISYNDYIEFGSNLFPPLTNGESANMKALFYTYVNYKDGDDINYKYISDIRQKYLAAKRKVAINLYKLKDFSVIAAYNEKDKNVVLYRYNK